ncbi:uncharacterized protein TNCV_1420711 [Trichonephila clavipes]|nr:uncharacterized protein TNCV_1420711 [Trichonephila clavipes]
MQTHYGPSPKGSLLYSRFFHRLHKRKYPWSSSRSLFWDGECYDDLYDFPHGQLRSKPKEDISTIKLFYVVYREFQEETGFHFKFTKEERVEQYPLVTLQYTGLDGSLYKQNYFIVSDVRGLKRHVCFNSYSKSSTTKGQITAWNDDRLIYERLLLSIEVAFRKFTVQQKMKSDMKHLLCSNYLERLYVCVLLDEGKDKDYE